MQQALRTTPVKLTFAKAPLTFYFQKIEFDILLVCGVLVTLATVLELSVEICVTIYFKNEPPKIIPISWYMLVAALTGVTTSAAQLLITRITCTRSTLTLFDSILDGISRVSLDPNKLSSVISAASVSHGVAFHGTNRAILGIVYCK
ncbi:hypothetical protein VHEMI02834 [[Torrubiella] hemipterigena]|uniref:Uncharacterized protein n=1 Tax=[Torrubiella] hemipterigena TaxID=1531966 RepID=A0A0A1SWV9_9HYPO|nr:hypothetical protein VHEMI02834 [[Torrubiella] hemipterigena]